MKRETKTKIFNYTLVMAVVAIIIATIIGYRSNKSSIESSTTEFAQEKSANYGIKLTSHISSSYASDLYYFNGNSHLFCAQRGGHQTFKSTPNYTGTRSMGSSEFEWIVDNIFDIDNVMSTQDKADMLGLDYNLVSRVYNDSTTRYILHQFIVWHYTNGVSVGGDVGTVCNAIFSLARSGGSSYGGYSSSVGGSSTQTASISHEVTYEIGNGGHVSFTSAGLDSQSYGSSYYGNGVSVTKVNGDEGHFDENGVFVWDVAVYSSSSNCQITVYVDGYQTTNYNYYNSTLKIYGVTPGNHNFRVEANAPGGVQSSYTIHTASGWQDILEITGSYPKPGGFDYVETEVAATGKYSLEIKKVDADNQPVSGTIFNVNGNQLPATDNYGIVVLDSEREIQGQASRYDYTISEISSGKDLAKLKDSVTLQLYSGLKNSSYGNYYAITNAIFESTGTNTCEVMTENGDKVRINAEMSYIEGEEKTVVTVTIPNPYKKYDLALTKTMILNKEEFIEKYDVNRDGQCNIADVLSLTSLKKLENNGSTYRDYNNEIATWTNAYNSYYKYLLNTALDVNDDMRYKGIYDRIRQFVFEITGDETSNYQTTANKLSSIIEDNSEDGEINRLNFINTDSLNKDSNVTTATYNMNKSTRVVKKNSVITYKYTVYNECDYDGKDIEITDYLPDGLKVCDENGNVVTSGNVTCKYNGVDYVWTIEESKAKIRINKTIGKYDGQTLNRESVYMTCKLDDSVVPGNILYNASEISDSTPVDSDGNTLNITDRDSQENSIQSETQNDVVNQYKQRFEDRERAGAIATDVNKDTYEYQDDDDFERIVIMDQKFDLALRKSITKVGQSESSMQKVPGTADSNVGNWNASSRLPKLTFDSASTCLSTGTGAYFHGKRFVGVKAEDYVEYTIRVYNEGSRDDYDGYAKQITDYLPDELQFIAVVDKNGEWINNATNGKYITSSNNLGHYEVSYDNANNKVVIDCVDTPILLTRNNLGDIATYDDSVMQTYYNIGNNSVDTNTYGYQEVKIICKLKENAPLSKYITNVAEITDDEAVDSDGQVVDINDGDSTPNSITIGTGASDVNLESYYENRGIDDIHIEYYEGIQDDDDFETVLIDLEYGPTEYSLKVKKVDEDQDVLTGASFSLKSNGNNLFENNGLVDDNGYTSTYTNGITEEELKELYYTGTTEITHSYTLREETAPKKYAKLVNPIYIDYKIKISKDNSKISAEMDTLNIYADGGYRYVQFSLKDDKGKKKTLSNVILENGEYCDIDVFLNNQGELIITVGNKPNTTGSYDIVLKKYGTDGKRLNGVKFRASGKFNGSTTSEAIPRSGYDVVSVYNKAVSLVPERYTDKVIKIDPDNYTIPDIITLEEYDITDIFVELEYYLGLKDKEITIQVNKDKREEENQIVYYVKSIELKVAGENATKISDTEYEYVANNGAKVNVKYVPARRTVEVSVTNPIIEIEGKYSLQVEKRGLEYSNGEYVVGNKLAGVVFEATGTIDTIALEPTESGVATDGEQTIKSPVQTTGEGVENAYIFKDFPIMSSFTDTIKLKETDIGPNFGHYLGTDKTMVITVDKEKEHVTTQDGVEKDIYRVTDVHLSMEATSRARLTETTDKSVTFKNGTKIEVRLVDQNITVVVTNPIKEGKYDINLVKYAKGDTNHPLGGVQFTATGVFSGAPPVQFATEQDPIVTSDEGPVEVKSNIRMTTNIDDPDIITLKEFSVGTNADTYIGITGNIELYVYKTTNNTNPTYVVNNVSRIALKVNGEDATAESDTKSRFTLDNGAEVIVEYNYMTEAIEIIVINPTISKEGQYSVQIEKRAPEKIGDIYANGQKLAGVTFTASGTIDGNNAPVSSTGYTSDNQPAIKSPLTTTGDGEENTYVIKDVEINTTTDDTYRFVETNIGDNKHFYIGTDKTILVTVTKSKEVVTENETTKEVYRAASARVSIEGIDSSEIETSSDTRIKLKNGTVVEVKLENNTVTLVVTNPIKAGTYNVKLLKYSTDDREHPVAGVKFTASATIDGTSGINIADEDDPIVTRSNGPVTVKSSIKMENAINQADIFTLREYDIGDNDGMFIGITGDIELTVYKKTDNSDPTREVNLVDRVLLKVNGQDADQRTNKIVLDNGAEVSVAYDDNTQTIIVTAVNPKETEEGQYSFEVEKRGLELVNGELRQGKKLEGVQFTVSGTIDGENIPATVSGIYDENKKGIRSPILTTGENSANTLIFENAQIRTELEDTFRFVETDIGYNNQYYLGTDKTIVVKVQKEKQVISTNGVRKTVYSATGATVSIEGISASDIKSQTNTRIELINGTIVEVTFENNKVKLSVTNPIKLGKYNLNILKYAKSDREHPVEGVAFTVNAKIDGNALRSIADENRPIVTSSEGPVAIVSNVQINDVQSIDKYMIKEYSLGQNTNMYEGIEGKIMLDVSKITDYSNPAQAENKIDSIILRVDGEYQILENINSNSQDTLQANIELDSGAEVGLKFYKSTQTIELIVVNPERTEEGEYSVQLEKRAPEIIGNIYANGQKLSGVWFNASGVVDGKEMPVTLTGMTSDNNVAVKSPLSTTGDGEENVYVVKNVQTRTTTMDTYTLRETSVGTNSAFVLGTDKDIVLRVHKGKTIVNDEGAIREVYTVTGATVRLVGVDSSLIKSQIETKIELINGTVIETSVENNTVTLIVTDPIKQGRYNLNLVKYSANNRNTPVAGVEFTATARIDGEASIVIADEDDPIVTSSEGAVAIESGIRMLNAVSQPDIFIIKETDVGPNTDMNIGITGNIELTVYKETDNSDPAQSINKVREISLRVNDQNAVQESATKSSITLDNGAEVIVEYNDDTQTVELTVVNPSAEQEGQYSVQLEKRAPEIIGDIWANGQKLENVKFEVSGKIDGVQMPVSSTGVTANNELAVRSPAYTTGEGQENVYIVKDAPIRTTEEDIYTFKEKSMGPNNAYYIGTDKDIILHVQKTKEIIVSNGVTKEVFKPSGVSIEIDDDDQIKTQTATRIELKNGTVIEANMENNTVTLVVTNPKVKGEYDINLVKYSQDDRTHPVAGVKFIASAVIDGRAGIVIADEDDPIVTSSEGPVAIKSHVKMEHEIGQVDRYYLTETDIGSNSDMYIGITGEIEVYVYKETVSPDGINTVNRVREVALRVNNKTVVQETIYKSKIVLENGAEVAVEYNEASSTVEVTVVNPKVAVEGQYSVQLEKRAPEIIGDIWANGQKLEGVKFEVSGSIDGKSMPVSETGLTADNELAIKSPAYTTGEGSENVYIVKDAQIRTTTEDIYTFKEKSIGSNGKYYIGTNKDIILRVQKGKEIINDNGIIREIFKATGATVGISGVPSSQIKSQTATKIELINGTVIEVSFENSTVTLIVTNPVKKGTYNVELVKYSTGSRNTPVAGVKFTASAVIDGRSAVVIADEEEPLVTSAEGPIEVKSNVKMENHVDVPDTFILKEFDMGQNSSMSLGITGDIELTVYKEVDNTDEDFAYNKVSRIALKVNGENVVSESDTKSKVTLDNGAEVIVEYNEDTQTIEITAVNPSLPGIFGLNLIKTIKGVQDPNDLSKQKPLPGAKFRITISDGTNIIYNSDNTSANGLETDANGKIPSITGLSIGEAGTVYTVTVEELSAPEGYIGLGRGNVKTFTVKSVFEDGEYKLERKDKTPIQNDSNITATVDSDSILIEAENKVKPEIHKGVKRVDNQSSGYDKNEIQTWVVETTVPAGINEYTKYVVTDEIDYEISNVADKRLKFINEENPDRNVVVKVKETGAVLTAGTDYRVEFTAGKVLKLTFIDSNNGFVAGRNMAENTTLEIKYNTQFALNADGSVKCINQAIPNKAILTYEVDGQGDDTESEHPEVHTGGLGVFKYDQKTGIALQGAHFKITKSKAEADKAVSAILENNSSKLAEVRFVKVIGGDGNETDTDVELITGENGYAYYTGLEFGEDAMNKVAVSQDPTTGANVYRYDWRNVSTTYYLVETVVPDEYLPLEQSFECTVRYNSFDVVDVTKYHKVANKPKEYDLALRKFITKVNERDITNRIPNVTLTDEFKNGTVTTAEYEHTKVPVVVQQTDIVTYTIRIFNEGPQDAYAALIKDDIPDGVVFVPYTEGDGSVNAQYRWKLVDENDNEVSDVSKAKYIVSDYLSKENGSVDTEGRNSNLLKAYNKNTMSELDYRDVKVQFRVIEPNTSDRILINYAQISKMTNSDNNVVKDRDSTPNVWINREDDQDIEKIRLLYMDLALRKFITGVTDGATGITQVVDTRYPQVNAQALIERSKKTADYVHPKDPVLVHTTDTVIYNIRVYNEGNMDGYATVVKDDMPEGLEFLPDHEINKQYEWTLVDANDNKVTSVKDATYVVTDYLSKDKESSDRHNLLKGFDRNTMTTPDYKEVKIAFKVTEPQTSDRILVNKAQITEQTDGNGDHREDIDSTPNVWKGEDDEDFENVRVKYFDLALRKWVTKAIVTTNGKTVVTETGHHAEDDPEDIVKLDLKKSKLDSVVVKFEYQIRITNEGEIAGYAKEIKDHIPEGLRFDQADNPTWTQLEENIITTDELKDVLLEPGESTEVTVVLTWINSGTNLGLKVNIAEISKDYNDYHTPDIDSTPDNFVAGEDDIDDAPVMLSVKTGDQVIAYVMLGLAVVAIIGMGAKLIKGSDKK